MPEPKQIIRWEKPPRPVGGGVRTSRPRPGPWDKVAVDLIANPGVPAVIQEGGSHNVAHQLAARVRRGLAACWAPAGDFDAVTRTVDGVRTVYAWYVGEGAS